MVKTILKSLGLVLVIGTALAWLAYKLRTDAIDPGPYLALGEGAANETSKLLNGVGRIVLVDGDYGPHSILAPTTKAEVKAFKKGIRKSHLKITAIERVPIAPPSLARTGVFMQAGQLAKLIARHPDVDAVVLFIGLAGPGDLEGILHNRKPKLILIANYEPYYKVLLEKKVIQMAILPRLNVASEAGEAIGSGKKWFERQYQVATPERMEDLVN